MYCSKCGANNSTEARYCFNCGTLLSHISSHPGELKPLPKVSEEQNTPKPTQQPNFIKKHWRGDYSLGISYWVIGTLLTFLVVIVSSAVGSVNEVSELGPRASGFFILSVFFIIYGITFWQIVGIWRSADKHCQRGGKSTWANLAKLMVILGLLRVAGDFSKTSFPLISEGAKLLAGIENTQPYEIRLLRNGTELELAGGMPFGTADAVKNFLDASPAIRVIHLNSQGGRMKEAYQLYKTIKARSLITYTSANCVSACTVAFLAGQERYLGENGRLGFHSVSIGDLSGVEIQQLNDEVRQKLKTHHVPDSFIEHALSTSPKDMWYPSKEELLAANVIDSVVDSKYFGLSGVTQWRDAHKIESGLLEIPVYSALAQYDQQNYSRIRKIIVEGIQNGRSSLEMQNDIRSIVLSEMIPKYLTRAPDDMLVRYWHSQISELRYLATLNPQHCADHIYPQFAKSPLDMQSLVPKELINEDIDALTAVVKGVAMNPQGHESSPTIEADLIIVLKKVAQKFPLAIDVSLNPGNYRDKLAILCKSFISFYSEILALPNSSRSGSLLRYVLSE